MLALLPLPRRVEAAERGLYEVIRDVTEPARRLQFAIGPLDQLLKLSTFFGVRVFAHHCRGCCCHLHAVALDERSHY